MNVLVTDGLMKKSLAVVRAISDVTAKTGVSAPHRPSLAGASRHTDCQHRLTGVGEAYVERLNRLIDRGGYEFVLPVGGRTFECLSAHRDRVRAPLDQILPPHRSIQTATDKLETFELARAEGVPAPKTTRLDRLDRIETCLDEVGLPAVVKAGTEQDPRFVQVVDSVSSAREAYRSYRSRPGLESTPVVQAYLPGESCGYFCLYIDGERQGSYTHNRVREYPPSGGASACAESHRDDELRDYGHQLLSALEWTGVAMVEFKRDSTGTPHVVELNPKLWGSLDLALASGQNFPRALLRHARGESDVRAAFSFTPRRVHWPLSGDLQHALRRPASASAVVRDLISPSTTSNIRLTDPLPHAVEAGTSLLAPLTTERSIRTPATASET